LRRNRRTACFVSVLPTLRKLVYRPTWRTDNHRIKLAPARVESEARVNGPSATTRHVRPKARQPNPKLETQGSKPKVQRTRRGRATAAHGSRARSSRPFLEKNRAPSARGGERGRRRTRQDQIPPKAKQPLVKLRTFEKDPHRTKKACFFCRTGFEGANAFQSDDPAV
jgi:hypothetical protein